MHGAEQPLTLLHVTALLRVALFPQQKGHVSDFSCIHNKNIDKLPYVLAHNKNMDIFLVCLVLLFISFIAKLVASSRRNLPRSPPSLPIIGHLYLLGNLPHRSLRDLSLKYGPLMHLKLGSKPTLVASSPHMAKTFLKNHDQIFASRPKSIFGKLFLNDHTDLGLAPYGDHWRQMRKICVMELFTPKRMAETLHVRQNEILSMVSLIRKESEAGKIINLNHVLSDLSTRVITQIALGGKIFESQSEAEYFRELSRESFILAGVFNLGDYLPFLSWLDLQGYQERTKRAHKKMDALLQNIIYEHMQKFAGQKQDLLDVLLATETDIDGMLSHDKIKAILKNILTGGTDTTAITVEWALAELLRFPHMLKKAQNEIDSVVGMKGMVEESDLSSLDFLNCVVKETFRLHPAAPLLVPHESTEDCTVEGFEIPKQTTLLVNVWAIGRDPNTWDEPEVFNPDRFLGSSKDVKGKDFDVLPFGSGRRMCPAWSMAICMIQLTLANLLHKFNWSLPAGQSAQDLDMSELFGLSLPRAIPLQAISVPR